MRQILRSIPHSPAESTLKKTKTVTKLVHPSLVQRCNPFLKPLAAWLRDFKTFQPLSITEVSAKIFAAPPRIDIMHRVVHWYRASLRTGTASTKHRSDVRGSTRKLHRQKGTGKARAGSIRAPQRRGGATCFGPKPRLWYYPLPEKVKNLGLKSSLSAKFQQGELSFVTDESLELSSHKTGELAKILENIPYKRILLIHHTKVLSENLLRASNSLKARFTVMSTPKDHINAYHVLKSHFVLLSNSAKKHLEHHFNKLPY